MMESAFSGLTSVLDVPNGHSGRWTAGRSAGRLRDDPVRSDNGNGLRHKDYRHRQSPRLMKGC